jgi:hypothetical protein
LKTDRGTGRGELADVITALSCAQHLGEKAGLESGQTPVLLITDNNMLRSFVLRGGLVSHLPASVAACGLPAVQCCRVLVLDMLHCPQHIDVDLVCCLVLPATLLQAHAVTPASMPTHMARLDDQEKAGNAAMVSFVDLLLLARAQCLVASDSGFSEAAWMLGGGRTCLARLQDSNKDSPCARPKQPAGT